MEGVGIYWCLTEMLFESEGHMPFDIDLLSYDLRSESKVISGVIDIAFNTKEGEVYSDWIIQELLDRLEAYNKKVEGKSKAGIMSGEARRNKKLLSNKGEHLLNKDEHVFDCVEQKESSVEQNELSKDKLSYPILSDENISDDILSDPIPTVEKNRVVMLSEEKKSEYKSSDAKLSDPMETDDKGIDVNLMNNSITVNKKKPYVIHPVRLNVIHEYLKHFGYSEISTKLIPPSDRDGLDYTDDPESFSKKYYKYLPKEIKEILKHVDNETGLPIRYDVNGLSTLLNIAIDGIDRLKRYNLKEFKLNNN
jgi:hypothetical protein